MRRDPDTDAPNLFGFARDYLHGYLPKARAVPEIDPGLPDQYGVLP